MRFWLVHPKYLDAKGLGGQWNEANMALGNLKKNKYHPAMDIFLNTDNPELYIKIYMQDVYLESLMRNYNYNPEYIKLEGMNLETFKRNQDNMKIAITEKQLEDDYYDLQNRLYERDYDKHYENLHPEKIEHNKIFVIKS